LGLKIKRFAEREEKPKQSKVSANERKKVVANRKEKFSTAAGVLEKKKCVQLFNDRLSCKKAKKTFSNARRVREKSRKSRVLAAPKRLQWRDHASAVFHCQKGLFSASKFGIILHRIWWLA